MNVLNFSHPLTPEQREQIEAQTDKKIDRLIEQPARLDVNQPFGPQITAMLDQVGFTATEWQQAPLLVVPPALNFATATMLAELHGRCGYFPPVVRLRPIKDSLPPQFELAEIINLQAIRDTTRNSR